MDTLANQVGIELGDDMDNLGQSWDPNETGDNHLWSKLTDRITEETPLRLLWRKNLEASDVSGHQNRFVIRRDAVEHSIVRCLTIQQRDDLCNNGQEIKVVGFNKRGEKWELKLKKRMQSSHHVGTYVLIGGWTKMVKANAWREGDEIEIWGFPYGGKGDHGSNEICFVFTKS